MSDVEYHLLLAKAQDAKTGGRDAWSVQSTGEKLAVALVLNHPDWIASMDYALAQAINPVGTGWLALIPRVERILRNEE